MSGDEPICASCSHKGGPGDGLISGSCARCEDGSNFEQLYPVPPVKPIAWPGSTLAKALSEKPEYTGKSVSYYRVKVDKPTSPDLPPYTAECNDIIEALGMNYAEGNAFKAIWRSCAARNLNLAKAGYKDGLYDAEKVVFFGERMVVQAK